MPYATTGNVWPRPERVTLSFMPDGANLGGPGSNLFAKFNAAFGSTAAWQSVVLKAAQVWAQQTNLNFSLVADNGSASGSGNYQQGDAAMGDIRFGGFAFGNSSLLGLGYMPPPVNNYSVAGDVAFNTGKVFKINGDDYDLFTVTAHELGHALGLHHSSSAIALLYSAYAGAEYGLAPDDIAGIRAIYGGPRRHDAFDAAAANGSLATARDISSHVSSSTLTAELRNLDITTTSDVDYYTLTVPANGVGHLKVRVQSSGLSLLAPSVRIYNASQTQVAAATASGYQGATLNFVLQATPGQRYYIRVAGANTTAFGTGAYALNLNFGHNLTPTSAPPNTSVVKSSPQNGGGGVANRTDENGVSVASLLVGVDRFAHDLVGDGLLSGLVDNVVSHTLELPFVEALPASAPAHEAHAPTIAAPAPVRSSDSVFAAPLVLPLPASIRPAPVPAVAAARSQAPSQPLPPGGPGPAVGLGSAATDVPEAVLPAPEIAPGAAPTTDREADLPATVVPSAEVQAGTTADAEVTAAAPDAPRAWGIDGAFVCAFALNAATAYRQRGRSAQQLSLTEAKS